MGIFEEIELADLAKAVRAIDGVARAIADPEATAKLRDLIDRAADERASADAAVALARSERETADTKLRELKAAGGNHADWVAKTEAAFRQRRADADQNEQRIAAREAAVAERERRVAERDAEHAAVRARLKEFAA